MKALKYYGFLLLLLSVFVTSAIIQSQYLINWDVSLDLLATRRLLAGGTYTHDFFNGNPPLILYLYIPIISLSHLFFGSAKIALCFYVYFLSVVSLMLCYFLIEKFFVHENRFFKHTLLLTLAIIFLIFPANQFGQREHLLVIFSMPYLFLMMNRLAQRFISIYFAALVGLFAILGFAIKPYFLIIPFFIETYNLFYSRRFMSFFRVENGVMALFLVFYFFFVSTFYHDYLTTIVPVVARNYYAGISHPWHFILFSAEAIYCYFAIFLSFFLYRKSNALFNAITLLAVLGCLIFYYYQRTVWYYHILPAFSFSFLLLVQYFLKIKNEKLKIIIGALTFSIPFLVVHSYNLDGEHLKKYDADLIAFLQTHAKNKNVYPLMQSFPEGEYAHIQSGSRFMCLFWVPYFSKLAFLNQALTKQQNQDADYFAKLMTEDMIKSKPAFILVDDRDYIFGYPPFDYLSFLSRNAQFREIWKHYKYVTTLTHFPEMDSRVEKWRLYSADSIENIDPEKFEGNWVVLTGTSDHKKAYYIKNGALLKSEQLYNTVFSTQVDLTPQEWAVIKIKKGVIEKTPENIKSVNQILYRTTTFPTYKFKIYEVN